MGFVSSLTHIWCSVTVTAQFCAKVTIGLLFYIYIFNFANPALTDIVVFAGQQLFHAAVYTGCY